MGIFAFFVYQNSSINPVNVSLNPGTATPKNKKKISDAQKSQVYYWIHIANSKVPKISGNRLLLRTVNINPNVLYIILMALARATRRTKSHKNRISLGQVICPLRKW